MFRLRNSLLSVVHALKITLKFIKIIFIFPNFIRFSTSNYHQLQIFPNFSNLIFLFIFPIVKVWNFRPSALYFSFSLCKWGIFSFCHKTMNTFLIYNLPITFFRIISTMENWFLKYLYFEHKFSLKIIGRGHTQSALSFVMLCKSWP